MTTISASEARQTLPAQLDRVEAGDQVAITRHGRVVAVLVAPEALRRSRAADAWAEADRIGELLNEARSSLPADGLSAKRADGLVAAVLAERRAR